MSTITRSKFMKVVREFTDDPSVIKSAEQQTTYAYDWWNDEKNAGCVIGNWLVKSGKAEPNTDSAWVAALRLGNRWVNLGSDISSALAERHNFRSGTIVDGKKPKVEFSVCYTTVQGAFGLTTVSATSHNKALSKATKKVMETERIRQISVRSSDLTLQIR